MAATSEEIKISLKILVDTGKKKVAFAEADYSFVDILISFMTLPMATIIRLLKKDSDQKFEVLGSLRTLYESVANLPTKCFPSEECKLTLLNPGNPLEYLCRKLKLKFDDARSAAYFTCEDQTIGCMYFSIYKGKVCCHCGKLMNREISLRLTDSSSKDWNNDGVFVSEMITFIITDDLNVMPSTTGSKVRLLTDLGLTDSGHLEERTVDIGLDEIPSLLKCVLSCKSPLSYLLLRKTNVTQIPVSSEQEKSDQFLNNTRTAISLKQMTLKFIWQRSTSKFLFMEAGEDFIDMVISFLTIPLGKVIGKLNGTTSLGCVDNLYGSISNMCVRTCMKSQNIKDVLLNPHVVQVLTGDHDWYGRQMNFKSQDPLYQKGLVKGPAMFMVTDDLVITPLSSVSSVDFLNKMNKLKVSLSDVEEHEVCIGMEEGLAILKASLKSSSSLTESLKLLLKKPKQEI